MIYEPLKFPLRIIYDQSLVGSTESRVNFTEFPNCDWCLAIDDPCPSEFLLENFLGKCHGSVQKKYFGWDHHSRYDHSFSEEGKVFTENFEESDNGFYNEILQPLRNKVGDNILRNSILHKFGMHLWEAHGFEKPHVVREKLRDAKISLGKFQGKVQRISLKKNLRVIKRNFP